MTRILAIVPLAAVAAGCYKYVPETAAAPVLGAEYRAHLTPPGAQSLAPLLGQSVISVDGRFVETRQNAWLVAVSATHKADDVRGTNWQGEFISVPRDAVARIERRQQDRTRTIRATVLAVGGGMAVTALLVAIGGKVSGNNEPGDPVIKPALVVP
jgi:hypothetical protein